ncbi:MAG: hypothetical protein IK093_13990 [Ruminiclostridium sp.]|nr:hypothetical protein [Ruminiclostridium sp.]
MSGYRTDIRTEEFENVTVFDKPMLFTCARCDRSTLPKGMFMYEVRHDDDQQGIPCEIAECILVNHWGTLISNRPIRLVRDTPNSRPYRLIDEETDWNYEGTTSTLKEYMERCPPLRDRDNER